MTSFWLRLGLIAALIGALFIGIWDFFRAPSAETAVAAVVPTVEEVERAREVTEPVVRFVAEQDQESVEQLVRQAELEFDASLAAPGAPVELINEIREVGEVVTARLQAHGRNDGGSSHEAAAPPSPTTSGSSSVQPGTEPGIEWYRDH